MNTQGHYTPNQTRPNGNGHGQGHAYEGGGFERTVASEREHHGASTGTLLRELMHEVPSLIGKEVALAKAEMREHLTDTREGIAAVSTGGAVALGGFVMLLLSVVYALSALVAPWLAALLVGGAALLIGLALMSSGRQKFSKEHLRPDRTLDSLRKDKQAIRGGH